MADSGVHQRRHMGNHVILVVKLLCGFCLEITVCNFRPLLGMWRYFTRVKVGALETQWRCVLCRGVIVLPCIVFMLRSLGRTGSVSGIVMPKLFVQEKLCSFITHGIIKVDEYERLGLVSRPKNKTKYKICLNLIWDANNNFLKL